mmetsp:Transcript_30088/g.40821  ORF Transcript_30088/g.40821 Transcript_30088/m.40821 type:complete len:92 (+) Transcript_30088:1761-2036(+)|eukprot:CAMPEP_0185754312 /NCGR_PEP_ID=MMETSP1174-20130828/12946_1 /TAXON_ID=35687 /ORGANISM="Dictyocha speculum, Strain CCMP1381" /LENGTH=91 /DNA_ID=CAMNT_0028432461 /DNA_START=1759 /DNA_END=2034 /DNA_ORIENTATION=+
MADELVEAREEKAKAERGCMRLQNRLKETVSSNGEVAKEGDGEWWEEKLNAVLLQEENSMHGMLVKAKDERIAQINLAEENGDSHRAATWS